MQNLSNFQDDMDYLIFSISFMAAFLFALGGVWAAIILIPIIHKRMNPGSVKMIRSLEKITPLV